MSKSSNFFGQPIYGQLIKSLDREKIVEISRKHGGEKYVKSFDGFTHLLTIGKGACVCPLRARGTDPFGHNKIDPFGQNKNDPCR